MEFVMTDRRDFMRKTGIALVTFPFLANKSFGSISQQKSKHVLCYFTKHLQWLDINELGIALSEAGFDGADLTVRSGGHVEPEDAATELPKAVSALARFDIAIPMVVTKVVDPDERGVKKLLEILADNGVKYYRLGYLNYDYKLPIRKNIEHFHLIFSKLAELNARYNICGVYQNHAGTRLGASIWDLMLALEEIDPDHLGCQFDVRHATFEGSRSWENDFRAIKDHIRTTVVKDFHWMKNESGQWTNNNTLMGEGMVDFDKYFKLYHELKMEGPISNHSEYPLITEEESRLKKSDKMKIAIKRLKQDVDYTRKFLT